MNRQRATSAWLSWHRLLASIGLMAGLACPAQATLLTCHFGGEIYAVASLLALPGPIAVGDRFSGTFIVDTTWPGHWAGGAMPGPAFTLELSGLNFGRDAIATNAGEFRVLNNEPAQSGVFVDGVRARMTPTTGDLIDDILELVTVDVALSDSSGSAFSSATLPVPGLDIGAFDWNEFSLHFRYTNGQPMLEPHYVFGRFEFLTSYLDEPPSAKLVFMALAVLMGLRSSETVRREVGKVFLHASRRESAR